MASSNSVLRPAGPHLMYVDDEAALVQLTTRMLQRMGYLVEGFTQAEQALDAFRADPKRTDVVATDFSMPRMSGLDLARELLAIRADICIVLISGYVDNDLVESCRKIGIQHVLYKANTMKELCESLRHVLEEAYATKSGGSPLSDR